MDSLRGEAFYILRQLSTRYAFSGNMEWHDKTCRRLDLTTFGDGMCCLSCGSIRPTLPILPPIRQLSEIRLLLISPGEFDDDLECKVITQSLSRALNYEAISYCWADENGDASRCRTISISGQPFQVTSNCEMALKRARMRHYTRTVWIDAICINQDDISERGHQVGLMPDIYSGAKNVLMYIGEVSSCSPTVQRVSVQRLLTLDVGLHAPNSFWAEMLATRYFTRLWILQEVVLARKATLMFGEQSLPWSVLREKARHWTRIILPPVFHFDYTTYSTPEQVFDLLCLAKSCDASEPLDKVFALLGLLPSRRIGNIEANYNLTPEELYTRVALHLASTIGWLPVLLKAGKDGQKGSSLSSLPSWVPDWSADARRVSIYDLPRYSISEETGPLSGMYHESRKSISLRLLYTPGLGTKWHYCGDSGDHFTVQNLYFPLTLSTRAAQLKSGTTSDLVSQMEILYSELHCNGPQAYPLRVLSLKSLDIQSQ